MKKSVKIAAGCVLAVACAAFAVYSMLAPLQIELQAVSGQTAAITFTEQGTFEYDNQFLVYPLLAGEVLEVRVQKGERVGAGDVLAVISATDYEYQIQQLQGTIGGYNAQIQNLAVQEQQEKDALAGNRAALEGQIAALQVQLGQIDTSEDARISQISLQLEIVRQNRRNVEYAEDNLEEIEDLYDAGLAAYTELAAAQQALATAKSTYAASQQQLEVLRAGGEDEEYYEVQMRSLREQIEIIDARMASSYTGAMTQYYRSLIDSANASIAQMQEKLGQAEITAPVGGIVRELPVAELNLISQQTPVATIASGEMVEVFIPIREIDGVKVGDRVEVILDKRLGEEVIEGVVAEIDDSAQIKYSALGVEERKIRALIRMPQGSVGIGYSMDVRFTVLELEDVLIVPKTAVFQSEQGDCVWAVQGGKLAVVPVEKGIETRDGYVITAGLLPGDWVVRDANDGSLSEGRGVKIPE